MNSNAILMVVAVLAVFAISFTNAAHDHHSGGGGSHHHSGGGGSHHHDHHGGGHHHHHHYTDTSIGSSYSGSSGSSGGPGLLSLLFGWNRPRYNYYGNGYGYGNYYNNYYNRGTGYCRVSRLVDYVGTTPRYYCDCYPYPPNYQWNYCTPMNAVSYGK